MSVPDLMLSMLHAAGVDPKTQPVTWHVGMNADGTIFGHMCFDPNIVSTADSHDKAEPSHCVGKRQPGVFVAGQRQSHSPAPLPAGLRQSAFSDRPPVSTTGSRQSFPDTMTSPAGPRQLSPKTTTAGSRQPSPETRCVVGDHMTHSRPQSVHSKRRTPSQCRRSVKRRAAWRPSNLPASDVLQKPPTPDSTPSSNIPDSDCRPAADVTQQQPLLSDIPELSVTASCASADVPQQLTVSDSDLCVPAADVSQSQPSCESVPHLLRDCDSAHNFERWKAWLSSEMSSDPLLSLLLCDSWVIPGLDKIARDVALGAVEELSHIPPGYLVLQRPKSASRMWSHIACYYNIIL